MKSSLVSREDISFLGSFQSSNMKSKTRYSTKVGKSSSSASQKRILLRILKKRYPRIYLLLAKKPNMTKSLLKECFSRLRKYIGRGQKRRRAKIHSNGG